MTGEYRRTVKERSVIDKTETIPVLFVKKKTSHLKSSPPASQTLKAIYKLTRCDKTCPKCLCTNLSVTAEKCERQRAVGITEFFVFFSCRFVLLYLNWLRKQSLIYVVMSS